MLPFDLRFFRLLSLCDWLPAPPQLRISRGWLGEHWKVELSKLPWVLDRWNRLQTAWRSEDRRVYVPTEELVGQCKEGRHFQQNPGALFDPAKIQGIFGEGDPGAFSQPRRLVRKEPQLRNKAINQCVFDQVHALLPNATHNHAPIQWINRHKGKRDGAERRGADGNWCLHR